MTPKPGAGEVCATCGGARTIEQIPAPTDKRWDDAFVPMPLNVPCPDCTGKAPTPPSEGASGVRRHNYSRDLVDLDSEFDPLFDDLDRVTAERDELRAEVARLESRVYDHSTPEAVVRCRNAELLDERQRHLDEILALMAEVARLEAMRRLWLDTDNNARVMLAQETEISALQRENEGLKARCEALRPHVKWLRAVAAGLYKNALYNWSNTCEEAADDIELALTTEAAGSAGLAPKGGLGGWE